MLENEYYFQMSENARKKSFGEKKLKHFTDWNKHSIILNFNYNSDTLKIYLLYLSTVYYYTINNYLSKTKW